MNEDKVTLQIDQGIALITLNDPGALNALSPAMTLAIKRALRQAQAKARAVVLTGAGRGFCSGANLAAVGDKSVAAGSDPYDPSHWHETAFNPMVHAIQQLSIPIVTAVNGVAAGGGCALALMGDLIVASDSAYFLQAFTRIGLVPDCGSSYLLPRLIGKARAAEMMLLADKLPARQAYEWGLINRCTSDADLMGTAMDLARRLAQGPASIGLTRRLIWEGLESGWSEQIANEVAYQIRAKATADAAEGPRAFLEKRPAAFTGR